jgi:hypothetical protein
MIEIDRAETRKRIFERRRLVSVATATRPHDERARPAPRRETRAARWPIAARLRIHGLELHDLALRCERRPVVERRVEAEAVEQLVGPPDVPVVERQRPARDTGAEAAVLSCAAADPGVHDRIRHREREPDRRTPTRAIAERGGGEHETAVAKLEDVHDAGDEIRLLCHEQHGLRHGPERHERQRQNAAWRAQHGFPLLRTRDFLARIPRHLGGGSELTTRVRAARGSLVRRRGRGRVDRRGGRRVTRRSGRSRGIRLAGCAWAIDPARWRAREAAEQRSNRRTPREGQGTKEG